MVRFIGRLSDVDRQSISIGGGSEVEEVLEHEGNENMADIVMVCVSMLYYYHVCACVWAV